MFFYLYFSCCDLWPSHCWLMCVRGSVTAPSCQKTSDKKRRRRRSQSWSWMEVCLATPPSLWPLTSCLWRRAGRWLWTRRWRWRRRRKWGRRRAPALSPGNLLRPGRSGRWCRPACPEERRRWGWSSADSSHVCFNFHLQRITQQHCFHSLTHFHSNYYI